MSASPTKLSFQHIKSNSFRILHADGATGGLTPRGQILVAFYNERLPIPESVTHHLGPDGVLGDEIIEERKTKAGIIREVEIGVMMDVPVAQALHVWLGQVLAERAKLEPKTGGLPQ
jgi:hypothetical protein